MSKIRQLPPNSQLARAERGDMADWSDLAENVARLVDLLDFYVTHQYAQWTADPDEVEAARRSRQKPPPFPLVRPVAARPPSLHDRLTEVHTAQAAEYLVDPLAPRMVTDDEFDAFISFETTQF